MTREDERRREEERRKRQEKARRELAEREKRCKLALSEAKPVQVPPVANPQKDPLTEEQKIAQAKAARIAKAICGAINDKSELRATVIPAKPMAGIDDWFVAVTDKMPDDQAAKLIAALPKQDKCFVALYGVHGDTNINVANNPERVEAAASIREVVLGALARMEETDERREAND